MLPGTWAVAQLPAGTALPAWAQGHEFVSITHAADEISIVCPADAVPDAIKAERGWVLFKVKGPLDFSEVGVLASIVAPLAAARVPVLALGTYHTDYILVKQTDVPAVIAAWREAHHHCDGTGETDDGSRTNGRSGVAFASMR